ncbi:MAG: PAS domain-containing protein [Gammaproteobacteria bacterium]|nr:PAS domain-containing protein [Gammaproteobacteria bacterium]
MKINEPVTQNEVKMREGSILVSKTNLKGIITYVNQDFLDISGFKESELIGKNHNVVRHPDMPPEAFQWLWDDIKEGMVWTAPVKNRAKNGDYYWVSANVSPIRKNGKVVEYMSVRTRPSDEVIRQTEQLYKDINAGKVSLEKTTTQKLVQKFKSVTYSSWMYLSAGGIALLMFLLAFLLSSGASVSMVSTILAVSGVVAFILGVINVRNVSKPIHTMAETLDAMSNGNYFDWIDMSPPDDLGDMMRNIFSTQVRLGFDVMDAREQAVKGERIKTALDNVSANVMVADADLNVIYINDTISKMFHTAEADFQKDIPDFKAADLLGSNIDIFHKNPSHQRGMLEQLSQQYTADLKIGGRSMRVIANPVSVDGRRVGTVAEWQDRTQEVAIENEISDLLVDAQAGKLDSRLSLDGKEGFFEQLASSLNSMLDVLEATFTDINNVMGSLRDGDLTNTIDRAYDGLFGEVKDNVNGTIRQLLSIVTEIRESSTQIDGTSGEIASGNNNLSSRTEQQAAALEQVASSMEEITSTVKQNADNAAHANTLATDAGSTADEGGKVVEQAVVAMTEINQSSTKIAEIIGVIDEIAFQTNLLALNASVEAARAGEQGRGFAVVATEVRNLAGRSATAAKEIKDLINDSVKKVQAGSELVNESGEKLGEIVNGVKRVKDIVAEIAAASSEQSTGVDQVSTAITSMDDLTQQNAALAEEASAASTNMSEQALQMNRQMQFFNTQGGGSSIKKKESSLDFALARNKHLAWKSKLRHFLDGKEALTSAHAVSHKQCDLGKWLYSDGMNMYGDIAAMVEMENVHEKMHGYIGDIIRKYNDGDQDGAEKFYQDVVKCSDTVVGCLSSVESEIKNR